jgi:hypothetical protein
MLGWVVSRVIPRRDPRLPPEPIHLRKLLIMNKSLVLAALVATFALAACGKKEEAPAPAPAPAAAPAPAPAPAMAPAAPAASAPASAASK